MSQFFAQPVVEIEIYPYNGSSDPYVISSSAGLLLEARIDKNIHAEEPGTFTLHLAPGGPQGVNSVHTWTEILTPMSTVIIKGYRWQHKNVLMIGIVGAVVESQRWLAAKSVQRTIQVTGYDFQYYFTTFNYYTLTFLGSTLASVFSQYFGNLALPALASPGTIGGPITNVGAQWFNNIMAGKDGILAKTGIAYKGSFLTFNDLVQQYYADIGAKNYGEVIIPYAENFLSSEGNWYGKFTRIFEAPWYEFFVITAETGAYYQSGMTTTKPKQVIPAFQTSYCPQMVARINPIPYLTYTNGTWGVDTTYWKQLTEYTLDGHGFISSTIAFSGEEVKNFFVVNPTFYQSLFGGTNSNISPFILKYQVAVDVDSVHRFGYRPLIQGTYWFMDQKGFAAQNNYANQETFSGFIESLLLRLVSWYLPTPEMGRGQMTTVFRPDILPGNRIVYAPFKNGEDWEFYITGVHHHFVFGGKTTTTLTLERGLPKTIYDGAKPQSTSNGQTTTGLDSELLLLLRGKLGRSEGTYQPNGKQGVQFIGMENAAKIIGEISQVFVTPQVK